MYAYRVVISYSAKLEPYLLTALNFTAESEAHATEMAADVLEKLGGSVDDIAYVIEGKKQYV